VRLHPLADPHRLLGEGKQANGRDRFAGRCRKHVAVQEEFVNGADLAD
jgi:hypothetical protein